MAIRSQPRRRGRPKGSKNKPKETPAVFPVTVNYAQSLEEMIKAGRYHGVNDGITAEDFQVRGEGTVRVDVVPIQFDRFMSTNHEAVREMRQMGYRPATLAELLAFGAQHWKRQPKNVAALGSVLAYPDGDRYVPYLCSSNRRRYLDLNWGDDAGDDWDEFWRFLAVHIR